MPARATAAPPRRRRFGGSIILGLHVRERLVVVVPVESAEEVVFIRRLELLIEPVNLLGVGLVLVRSFPFPATSSGFRRIGRRLGVGHGLVGGGLSLGRLNELRDPAVWKTCLPGRRRRELRLGVVATGGGRRRARHRLRSSSGQPGIAGGCPSAIAPARTKGVYMAPDLQLGLSGSDVGCGVCGMGSSKEK